MILTRSAIDGRRANHDVVIDPPPLPEHCGPNSIDLHLGARLVRYRRPSLWERLKWLLRGNLGPPPLDPANLPPLEMVPMIGGRWLLRPGELYLAETLEWTETRNLVPVVDGRSSTGRIGVGVHVTAGRGDVGFRGRWTLEVWCVQAVWIWPGMRALQITYHEIQGSPEDYTGQYQGARRVMPSGGQW